MSVKSWFSEAKQNFGIKTVKDMFMAFVQNDTMSIAIKSAGGGVSTNMGRSAINIVTAGFIKVFIKEEKQADAQILANSWFVRGGVGVSVGTFILFLGNLMPKKSDNESIVLLKKALEIGGKSLMDAAGFEVTKQPVELGAKKLVETIFGKDIAELVELGESSHDNNQQNDNGDK